MIITTRLKGIDVNEPGQCLIYRAVCKKTKLSYVGMVYGWKQTVLRRWEKHVKEARRKVGPKKLGAAIRRFGAEGFRVCVIDRAKTRAGVEQLEKFYVAKYDSFRSGYNGNPGGPYSEKEAHLEGVTKYWCAYKNRRKQSTTARRVLNPLWKLPSYRKKMSGVMRDLQKRLWAQPKYAKKIGKIRKSMWSDPAFRTKMSNIQKKAAAKKWADPKYRARRCKELGAAGRKAWENPVYRERMRKILKAVNDRRHNDAQLRATSRARRCGRS